MKNSARQTQKENTREKIVKAACAEFSARGILGTRMSDVAQAAHVSHGTVFLHFKTQEELVTEVIGAYAGKMAARMHELARSATTLREILAAHLAGIAEFEALYTRLALEARLLPEPCRSAWIGIQSAISLHLNQAAEQEMRAGRLKPMPAHFLFNAWSALVQYYLVNGDLFAPDGSVIGRCGSELVDQFIRLVSVDNGNTYKEVQS